MALITRRRILERTIEGLGKHGLVACTKSQSNCNEATAPTSVVAGGSSNPGSRVTTNLVPLRQALKEELEMRTDAFKLALHKIESLGKHAGLHKGNVYLITDMRINV